MLTSTSQTDIELEASPLRMLRGRFFGPVAFNYFETGLRIKQ